MCTRRGGTQGLAGSKEHVLHQVTAGTRGPLLVAPPEPGLCVGEVTLAGLALCSEVQCSSKRPGGTGGSKVLSPLPVSLPTVVKKNFVFLEVDGMCLAERGRI